MKFNSLIPELSVTSIEKSKEFYKKLGFEIIYERKKDKFAFIQLEENQIMIEEINENWNTGKLEYPYGRGINISMSIKNVEDYYKKLKEKGLPFYKEIMINKYEVNGKVYDDIELLIQDVDGYLLRFNN